MEPLWLFSQVPTKTPSDTREAQGQGKQRKSSTILNDALCISLFVLCTQEQNDTILFSILRQS